MSHYRNGVGVQSTVEIKYCRYLVPQQPLQKISTTATTTENQYHSNHYRKSVPQQPLQKFSTTSATSGLWILSDLWIQKWMWPLQFHDSVYRNACGHYSFVILPTEMHVVTTVSWFCLQKCVWPLQFRNSAYRNACGYGFVILPTEMHVATVLSTHMLQIMPA